MAQQDKPRMISVYGTLVSCYVTQEDAAMLKKLARLLQVRRGDAVRLLIHENLPASLEKAAIEEAARSDNLRKLSEQHPALQLSVT